jgi:hypothetical protein
MSHSLPIEKTLRISIHPPKPAAFPNSSRITMPQEVQSAEISRVSLAFLSLKTKTATAAYDFSEWPPVPPQKRGSIVLAYRSRVNTL